jgi:hypothetical protein
MLIPAQNSNKANYKFQDCFANRQIKEDVKCNNQQQTKMNATNSKDEKYLNYPFFLVSVILYVV